jgi:RNA polymerase sigma-70 factor (ECF subfamily)
MKQVDAPISAADSTGAGARARARASPGPVDGAAAPAVADATTRPSIFLRLNASEPAPRELAWRQFYDRYGPIIQGYARRRGASKQQADEVVQDVVTGFFAASPRFVYDPSRGRFRAYLRTCAAHALSRLRGALTPAQEVPVEDVQVVDARDDELWDRLWQQQLLRRAMELVRDHYTRKGKLETFLAFEQNVVLGRPAPDVARELSLNVNSVHAAKSRVTQKLREVRDQLNDEDG